MIKILYYDCFSGISGDMNLGAMIDLGVDAGYLLSELQKLKLPGWELNIETDQRHGITGTKVTVVQTVHEHVNRHLSDIIDIILKSELKQEIRNLAIRIFTVIAEAEAKVHGMTVEDIHFHEVGAIDAIIDIVGAAICYDYLNPDKVFLSVLELGGGFVKCAHGTLPVPAPATIEIVKEMPVRFNGVNFEATTPTGAAIISVLSRKGHQDNQPILIKKTGYGIGHKEHPDIPNVLRVSLAEADETNESGHESLIIECNIDDMNPELYEYVSESLFEAGASDVFLTNIIMKKGRPGVILSVICEKGNEPELRRIIFQETTTIGLRATSFKKSTLSRKSVDVITEFGKVRFKYSYLGKKLVSAKPEYDDCRDIAAKLDIPLKDVINKLNKHLSDD